ncbi:MAG: threonine synthase [Dehalococcoidia bacterium]|nr:threonine synthase [Dehalococcoidia bacterium]
MALTLSCTYCEASFPADSSALRCPACGEPLEYRGYARPSLPGGFWTDQTLLGRYSEFLPPTAYHRGLSLGEGFTPLVEAPGVARRLGVSRLLVKNETVNPTWSFKDRGTVVALADALRLGSRALGVVSTGNMAASVAAYGARAGLPVLVLVSAETPVEKLTGIVVYGPEVVRVHGDYGDLYYRSLELEGGGVRFLNSDAPARVEGSKTIAFEICEQLGFESPDWVVVPTSSGGNIRGILKGFEEMAGAGLTTRVPRMVCVQARGCAPIAEAWVHNHETILPVSQPRTIAHAIANPRPPSGNAVLRRLRATGGLCVEVDDADMVDSQLNMARAGVFGQPEAAAPLAAANVMAREGMLNTADTVVCIATGSGLKYPSSVEPVLPEPGACSIAELEGCVASWLAKLNKGGSCSS